MFHKYRTAEQARQILTTRLVWWCSPLQFNDPFDTHYFWRFAFSLDDASRALAARMKRLMECDDPLPSTVSDTFRSTVLVGRLVRAKGGLPQLLSHMDQKLAEGAERVNEQIKALNLDWQESLRVSMRVFCLSEVYDDLLMWAHYADCHRGAVIGFRDVLGKNTALCGTARPVTYQPQLPAVVNSADEWAAHVSGAAPIDMKAAFLKMAFTKSDHWSYEKEWRCWDRARTGDDRLAEPIRVDHEDFAAVYLGCCMKPDYRDSIVRIVREQLPHVLLHQARQSETRFRLDFDSIESPPENPHAR